MPVPADITHMTEALRRRIDWQEREGLVGTVRPGRQRGIQDVTSRKSRWVGTINLQRPAAGERPTAANGATSFHTRLSTISRSDSATAAGRSSVNAAVGQERYLTDNWARELSRAAGSERYVVDGDQADDSVNDPDSRVVFIHSNISDVGVERIAFWEEAWRVERKAGAPRLRLNLTTMSESDRETLSADPNAPAALINIVAALRRGEQIDQGRCYVRDGSRLLELELRQEDLDWAGQLGTTYGDDLKTRGLHFVRPRFGQVQKQFVASLPAELDAAAHRDIVTQFGAELDTLGLPFTAALHRPNGYNHRANHHPHFIFYPAICRRGADGRFDLASGRKLRPGELAGWTKERRQSTFHQTSASADVVALRKRFADICNFHLTRARSGRLYDPRTYEQMGIAAAPMMSLGKAASALVKAGIDVPKDRDNARTYWSARKLEQANRSRERRDHHVQILKAMQAIEPSGGDMPMAMLRDELTGIFQHIEEGRDALDEVALQREMAFSAGVRLAENCARLIADIDAGLAKSADVRERNRIAARHQLALAHMDEIEQAIAPYQATAQRHTLEMERLEARAQKLCDRIALEQAWVAGSVLAARHITRLSPHRHFDKLIRYIHRHPQQADDATTFVHLWREDGRTQFKGLKSLDLELLVNPAFAFRADRALEAAILAQTDGVGRLLRYVAKHGVDQLEARTRHPKIANDAIATLNRLYGAHPLFLRGRFDADVAFVNRNAPNEKILIGEPHATQERGEMMKPVTDHSTVKLVSALSPLRAGSDGVSAAVVPVATRTFRPNDAGLFAKQPTSAETKSVETTAPITASWNLDEDVRAALGAANFYPRLSGEDDGGPGSISRADVQAHAMEAPDTRGKDIALSQLSEVEISENDQAENEARIHDRPFQESGNIDFTESPKLPNTADKPMSASAARMKPISGDAVGLIGPDNVATKAAVQNEPDPHAQINGPSSDNPLTRSSDEASPNGSAKQASAVDHNEPAPKLTDDRIPRSLKRRPISPVIAMDPASVAAQETLPRGKKQSETEETGSEDGIRSKADNSQMPKMLAKGESRVKSSTERARDIAKTRTVDRAAPPMPEKVQNGALLDIAGRPAEGQATPTTSARAQATAPNIKPVGRAHLAVKEALFPEPWLSNQLAAHRESPQYRALPSPQRDLLDEAAAMPLHYLGAGLGAIVRSDGCINIGFSSAAVWESFCALRDIPGGWQMLNAVARPSSENDKFKLDLQWNRIIIADQVEAEMPISGIGRPRDRGR